MIFREAVMERLAQLHQFIESLLDLRHRVFSWPLGILVSQFDQDLCQPTNRAHELGW
jgi:hypothetical protein